jgi:hypothetical protein
MFPTRASLLTLLVLSTATAAESFSYVLYEIESDGKAQLGAKAIEYTPSDPIVRSEPGRPAGTRDRMLVLEQGFVVGCSDEGRQNPSGIGCWLERRRSPVSVNQYAGFSWEWYDHGVGSLFAKRKGTGSVAVQLFPSGSKFMIGRIEFIDDTVFQVNLSAKSEPGVYTHEVLIKGGSVLAFPPEVKD